MKIFSLLNYEQQSKIMNIWHKLQNLIDNSNIVFYKPIYREFEKKGFKNHYFKNYDWSRLMIYIGRFLQLLSEFKCEHILKYNCINSVDIKNTYHHLIFYLSPILRFELAIFIEDNVLSFKSEIIEV